MCGEQFTAADVVLGSALGWGLMFGTIDKRSSFEAYVGRLQQREAAKRANGLNEVYLNEGEGRSKAVRMGCAVGTGARNRRRVGSK